jgi:RNA-directed DNA polymerase
MNADITPLNLFSLRDLEHRIGFNRRLLLDVAGTGGRFYRPFPKKGLKPRRIDNPVLILKAIQKNIQDRLLSDIPLPDYMHGGVPGRSPITNAKTHLGAPVLVTLDIRKFFPSVTNKHIFHVWRDVLGCSPTIARFLTQLTTFERHLPQGAATSTTLANIVLAESDEQIKSLCDDQHIVYTRFVDDLIFSGESSRHIINSVVKILKKAGFRVPHAKMRVTGPRKRHQITGIVVNGKIAVPREKRAKIRAAIHSLESLKEPGKQTLSIIGRIGFVRQVNPRSAESLQWLLERTKEKSP